jgi:hypothetical protein
MYTYQIRLESAMLTVTLSRNTTNKMVCLENIVYVVNILKSVLITLVSYSYTVDIVTFHSIFISGKFTFDKNKNIQPIGDMHILPAMVIFISKYKY